jgi:hypothetical protein
MPFYFVSEYPPLQTHYHNVALLLTKPTFVTRGPFYLPPGNYEQIHVVVSSHLDQLRQAAPFFPPHYSWIEHK